MSQPEYIAALLVMSQVGNQTARALSEGFGINEQELLVNGVAVLVLGTLILTDRWWVHAPVSVLYFLAVAWSTIGEHPRTLTAADRAPLPFG